MGLSEGLGYIYKGKPLMEGVGERIGHGIEQGTQNYLKGQELSAEKKRQKELELHKQKSEVNKLIKPLENPNVLQSWQPEYQNEAKGLAVHTDLLYSKGINPPDDKLWREHLAQVDLMKQQMENDTKEHLKQKDLGQKDINARERQPFANAIENSKYSEFKKLYPSGYEDKNLQYDTTHPYKAFDIKKAISPTYHDEAAKAWGKDQNGKVFKDEKYIDEVVTPAAVEDILSGRSEEGNKAMQIIGRQADEMKVDMLKKANDPYLKYPFTPEQIDQHVDDWKRDMITKDVNRSLHAEADKIYNENTRLRQPTSQASKTTTEPYVSNEGQKQIDYNEKKTSILKSADALGIKVTPSKTLNNKQKIWDEYIKQATEAYKDNPEKEKEYYDVVDQAQALKLMDEKGLTHTLGKTKVILNNDKLQELQTEDGVINGRVTDFVDYMDNKGKVKTYAIAQTFKDGIGTPHYVELTEGNKKAIIGAMGEEKFNKAIKEQSDLTQKILSSQGKKEGVKATFTKQQEAAITRGMADNKGVSRETIIKALGLQ